jgi:hypothetical protein
MTVIQKTVKVVKDQFFTLALAATFVGFSAFKYAERFAAPESGWYEVDAQGTLPADYDDPAKQTIGSHLENGPNGVDCDQTFEEKPCAVYLEFNESTYMGPTNIENQELTVEEIINEPGAEISSEGYARRDE